MSEYKLLAKGEVKGIDGAIIPNDPGNKDWIAYQEWLALGNIPDPLELIEERVDGWWKVEIDYYGNRISEIMVRSKADQIQKQNDIDTNFPSWNQVATAINNISTLAEAKAILLKMARVEYWLAKNTQN
jgi:hypothetical protein